MFPSVQTAFRSFSEKFEGCVSYMYLDIKGLVTVGVGNLVDPVALAQALPFRFKNKPEIPTPGAPATPDQIAAEWQKLKGNANLAREGFKACEPITELELSDDDIDSLILARVTGNETFNLIANTVYHLHDTLLQSISTKQWQTINVHMETNRQDLTARKLRLNESTVSRNLRRGFWWQIQETRQAMERVIEAYFP